MEPNHKELRLLRAEWLRLGLGDFLGPRGNQVQQGREALRWLEWANVPHPMVLRQLVVDGTLRPRESGESEATYMWPLLTQDQVKKKKRQHKQRQKRVHERAEGADGATKKSNRLAKMHLPEVVKRHVVDDLLTARIAVDGDTWKEQSRQLNATILASVNVALAKLHTAETARLDVKQPAMVVDESQLSEAFREATIGVASGVPERYVDLLRALRPILAHDHVDHVAILREFAQRFAKEQVVDHLANMAANTWRAGG